MRLRLRWADARTRTVGDRELRCETRHRVRSWRASPHSPCLTCDPATLVCRRCAACSPGLCVAGMALGAANTGSEVAALSESCVLSQCVLYAGCDSPEALLCSPKKVISSSCSRLRALAMSSNGMSLPCCSFFVGDILCVLCVVCSLCAQCSTMLNEDGRVPGQGHRGQMSHQPLLKCTAAYPYHTVLYALRASFWECTSLWSPVRAIEGQDAVSRLRTR